MVSPRSNKKHQPLPNAAVQSTAEIEEDLRKAQILFRAMERAEEALALNFSITASLLSSLWRFRPEPVAQKVTEIKNLVQDALPKLEAYKRRVPARTLGRNDHQLVYFCTSIHWLTGTKRYKEVALLLNAGYIAARPPYAGKRNVFTAEQLRKICDRFRQHDPEAVEQIRFQIEQNFLLS